MIFKLAKILGINTAGFNQALLHFAGWEKPLNLWLGGGLIVLFLLSGYFLVKPLAKTWQKILILLLHFFALLFAVFIFWEPQIRLLETKKTKAKLAILIDSSQSMNAPGGKNLTRIELAKKWIKEEKKFLEKLETDYQLVWFKFDKEPSPISFSALDQLKTEGNDTRILNALSGLRTRFGGKPWAGVLLLSEGRDWGELNRYVQELSRTQKKKIISSLKNQLKDLGRIYPLLCSEKQEITDLAISQLKYDAYGYVKNPLLLQVKIRAQGKLPAQSQLQLWQEEELIASKQFELKTGENTIELEFVPSRMGRFLFRIELPEYQGEVNFENNQKVFPLSILRDRIRILYIVGNPSWDEKFLRRTLKKNPAVDLVSFYILREYYDDPRAREDELALIPFPTHKLFTEELESFDLVIFQNFFGRAYMLPGYIKNLRDYVLKGGGLIYIGGPRAYIKDLFTEPLEKILPFEFSFQVPSYKEEEFELELTPAGEHHPLTRLEKDLFKNQQVWKEAGKFKGYNQVLRAKPQALVLVQSKEEKIPIIGIIEPGKGRVLAITTDSLWQWRFNLEENESRAKYYQIFWERALRWLMREKEMKPLSLSASKDHYEPGEEIQLLFQVRDRTYQPVESANTYLEPVKIPENCPEKPLEKIPGQEIGGGNYQFKFSLPCPGGYRFRARAEKNRETLGSDEEILVVEKTSREMQDLSLGKNELQLLAEASGGKFLTINQSLRGIKFPQITQEQATAMKDFPLWNNSASLIIFLILAGLLWSLRRYWGLS